MDVIAHKLCKRYGEQVVLHDFSAQFPENRITCIMGPSGCGKTTLLRLLLGLEAADSGEITGNQVPKAAVFQDNRLFEDFTVLSNLLAVLPRKTEKAMVLAHLDSLGLAAQCHAPVRTLSGGMKRRVALVRAMLAPASLVVLDEPFTGLDAETKQRALTFTRAQAIGKTVLVVTHDSSEAAFFGGEPLRLSPL